MDRDPISQPLAAVQPALEGDDDLDARKCGRCRRVLQEDPSLDVQGRKEWALCPPCQAILFPRRAASAAKLTLVPPIQDSGS